jgi:hypothetical protein
MRRGQTADVRRRWVGAAEQAAGRPWMRATDEQAASCGGDGGCEQNQMRKHRGMTKKMRKKKKGFRGVTIVSAFCGF